MRMRNIGIGKNERISDAPIEIQLAIEANDKLSLQHKVVLLKLRNTEVARLILDKLAAMGAPEPSPSDWRSMIDATYVRRSFERSFAGALVLTPQGLHKASTIMRELAGKYGIHSFTTSGGRTVRRGTIVKCACGWSAGPFHNDRFGESRMRSAQAAHLNFSGNPDAVVASVVGAASGQTSTVQQAN